MAEAQEAENLAAGMLPEQCSALCDDAVILEASGCLCCCLPVHRYDSLGQDLTRAHS